MKSYNITIKGKEFIITQNEDGTFNKPDEIVYLESFGSALKPAWEPIIIAMKPLDGTFAHNALTHGVAGLHIDAGRIETSDNLSGGAYSGNAEKLVKEVYGEYNKLKPHQYVAPLGRWPANLILDEDSAEMLDEQSGDRPSGYRANSSTQSKSNFHNNNGAGERGYADKGGASRFFYVAKASRKERDRGLDDMPDRVGGGLKGTEDLTMLTGSGNVRNNVMKNNHPTVKPIKLLEYLCRLSETPTGGIVFDPFMGSGSTGIAAISTNRSFIGIDISREYVDIAQRRMENWTDSNK